MLTRLSRTPCYVAGMFALALAPRNAMPASPATSVAQELDTEFSYVGDAAIRGGDGQIDEVSAGVKYVLSLQLNKRVLLRVGAEWQRFSFGVPGGTALPDTLQQVSAIIGCDAQLTDQWLLRAELQPGVYSDFADVSWRDVDAPFVLSAAYVVDADLQWFVGLRVDPRSQYLVLPAVGVRWKFADEWTLNLLLPRPRLEYEFNEKLKGYVGAVIKAGTFRVGDHFGGDHGRSDLNHAMLDYLEARVGPGLSWDMRPGMTLEANAGYMVYRRFDFFDQHATLRSEPAPYVQITFHVRF
jgi:hypothetical protein